MNPISPEEAGFRGQSLSPVSPKPLHFPKPSNIPLLEDQMNPAYNGSSSYAEPPPSQQILDTGKHTSQEKEMTDPSDGSLAQGEDGEPSEDVPAEAVYQNGFMTAGPDRIAVSDQANIPTLPPPDIFNGTGYGQETLNGVSPAAATGTDVAIVPDQSTFVASELSDAPPTAATSLTGPLNHLSNGYDQTSLLAYEPNDQSSGVHLQALLDTLSSTVVPVPAPLEAAVSIPSPLESTDAGTLTAVTVQTPPSATDHILSASLPNVAGLPPRPPPQNNPTNLVSESDLRSYHFHDHQQQQQSSAQKYVPPPGASLRPPGNLPPPISNVGAPGTTLASNNLPPPPVATFQTRPSSATQQSQASPSSATYRQRDQADDYKSNDDLGDDDNEQRWGLDVQRKYDAFLEDERMYVTRGEWHTFPANSRLFIGNLPTEKVTKRDLFHVFHKHGKLAQVSIKQAYGFIQYLEAQDCLRALQAEQGVSVRGRKIHLEISKPQRGNQSQTTTSGESRAKANRRSRSPDYTRGGTGAATNQRGADRYRTGSGNGGDARQRDSPRGRDDYRPGRSPSPRPRRRSPNRRRRSRSRSPRTGYRSPSPRRAVDDDCPLPRRAPHDIPDVQIIAKDDPDRAFVSYVEKAFEARGIKCNVLILSPRLSEASVVRRQIIEGVLAVMKLDRPVQMTQKFQLSVFDRSGGANNVKFEEYADLALNICVELVLRAKQNAAPAMPQYYGLPVAPPMAQTAHQQQPSYQSYPPPSQPSSQFPSLDTSSLQQLLGRAQQSAPHRTPQPSVYGSQQQFFPSSDLSRLLASAGGAPHQQSQSPYQQPPQQQQPITHNLGALAGLLGNQGPTPSQQQPQQRPPSQQLSQSPAQPQQKPDMANLMAMLGRYK